MGDFTERPAPGTKIHVEFDATVEPITPDQYWAVAVGDHTPRNRLHYVNWESDVVTKVSDPEPENWPPQPGDTWRLKCDPVSHYHVIRDSEDGLLKFYTPFGGFKYQINPFAPDNWELAYRPEHIV